MERSRTQPSAQVQGAAAAAARGAGTRRWDALDDLLAHLRTNPRPVVAWLPAPGEHRDDILRPVAPAIAPLYAARTPLHTPTAHRRARRVHAPRALAALAMMVVTAALLARFAPAPAEIQVAGARVPQAGPTQALDPAPPTGPELAPDANRVVPR